MPEKNQTKKEIEKVVGAKNYTHLLYDSIKAHFDADDRLEMNKNWEKVSKATQYPKDWHDAQTRSAFTAGGAGPTKIMNMMDGDMASHHTNAP